MNMYLLLAVFKYINFGTLSLFHAPKVINPCENGNDSIVIDIRRSTKFTTSSCPIVSFGCICSNCFGAEIGQRQEGRPFGPGGVDRPILSKENRQ
jgi:hypothetical protein